MSFWDDVGDPLWLSTDLPDCLYRALIRTSEVAVKLRSRRTKVVLSHRFLGAGYTPDFGHAFSNRTYLTACGRFWLSSSVHRARRVADEITDRR